MPRTWLMKSEPDVFSLDDLRAKPHGTSGWDGVRNYQARNYMRDDMRTGDLVLFYHSSTTPPGVVGLAQIVSPAAYPDPSQFDAKSEYYDAKATPEAPRWLQVDVAYRAHFPRYVTLDELKADPALEGMLVLKRGQRLSIQPVEEGHFYRVCELGGLDRAEVDGILTLQSL